ncbi:hypothetical protein Pcinc_012700 [Petrolisthes cinctipes]|uniref:Uncharacterized protein n=1 Tax=Petrolisthes cinctipes TaxID=88211 RepID=A0AAE1FYD4_PETCI|nr:hypothetical protein Pcinc_012700 [Petrolisthes cinctipes]
MIEAERVEGEGMVEAERGESEGMIETEKGEAEKGEGEGMVETERGGGGVNEAVTKRGHERPASQPAFLEPSLACSSKSQRCHLFSRQVSPRFSHATRDLRGVGGPNHPPSHTIIITRDYRLEVLTPAAYPRLSVRGNDLILQNVRPSQVKWFGWVGAECVCVYA